MHIYILIDPRTNKIRYVGKTIRPVKLRLQEHCLYQKEHNHRAYWLNELRLSGIKPIMQIVDFCIDSEWAWHERWWIAYGNLCGWQLVNSNAGGEGSLRPSEEVILKRGQAIRKAHQREETKNRLRLAAMGNKNAQGAKRTPDYIEALKLRCRGEKAHGVKLTQQAVLDIQYFVSLGVSGVDLSKMYHISPQTISSIKHGRRWGWVTEKDN